uniref:Uncharacterized protein n=1 Tax=Leersia perrieri TaxID=77586 RepID=A0A0D9WKJ1_9ORYZ
MPSRSKKRKRRIKKHKEEGSRSPSLYLMVGHVVAVPAYSVFKVNPPLLIADDDGDDPPPLPPHLTRLAAKHCMTFVSVPSRRWIVGVGGNRTHNYGPETIVFDTKLGKAISGPKLLSTKIYAPCRTSHRPKDLRLGRHACRHGGRHQFRALVRGRAIPHDGIGLFPGLSFFTMRITAFRIKLSASDNTTPTVSVDAIDVVTDDDVVSSGTLISLDYPHKPGFCAFTWCNDDPLSFSPLPDHTRELLTITSYSFEGPLSRHYLDSTRGLAVTKRGEQVYTICDPVRELFSPCLVAAISL